MKRTILLFASLIVALLVLLQLGKYSLVMNASAAEWIMAVVALLFFGIGVVINRRTQKKETLNLGAADPDQLQNLGISNREYEVLLLVAKGCSNKEIADQLFVTESTIKTHVSNILVKLDAKRRTEALVRARELKLIASLSSKNQ